LISYQSLIEISFKILGGGKKFIRFETYFKLAIKYGLVEDLVEKSPALGEAWMDLWQRMVLVLAE